MVHELVRYIKSVNMHGEKIKDIRDIFKISLVLNFEHRTADNKRWEIAIKMLFTNI